MPNCDSPQPELTPSAKKMHLINESWSFKNKFVLLSRSLRTNERRKEEWLFQISAVQIFPAYSFFLVIGNYWSQIEQEHVARDILLFSFILDQDQGFAQLSILLPTSASAKNGYIEKSTNRTSTHSTSSCYHPCSDCLQFRLLPETRVILYT